jgi:CheY-like chemotaxis protein
MSESPNGTKKQLLLVDDDPDFRELLGTKLREGGFAVATAVDGDEGVAKALEVKPDLILMDVKMPKVDGVTALLRLKENPATKDIHVVLLTAFGDPQPEIYGNDKRFAAELGAFEYLLKTQDLDDIVVKVKALVEK